ncbi:hypothetical protein A2U01_0103852, partial [Trifolium medium]|nr:hypothetical protein [Trifolium medium]
MSGTATVKIPVFFRLGSKGGMSYQAYIITFECCTNILAFRLPFLLCGDHHG